MSVIDSVRQDGVGSRRTRMSESDPVHTTGSLLRDQPTASVRITACGDISNLNAN